MQYIIACIEVAIGAVIFVMGLTELLFLGMGK